MKRCCQKAHNDAVNETTLTIVAWLRNGLGSLYKEKGDAVRVVELVLNHAADLIERAHRRAT